MDTKAYLTTHEKDAIYADIYAKLWHILASLEAGDTATAIEQLRDLMDYLQA